MNRRLGGKFWGTAGALALLVTAAVMAWVLPTPYYVLAPGAAYDTAKMVHVGGSPASVRGKLLMLAVADMPANPFFWLYAKVDHTVELYPKQEVLRAYGNYENYLLYNYAVMADSQNDAKLVAELALGYQAGVSNTGATILSVTAESKAGQVLRKGDVIVGVGSTAVRVQEDVVKAMQAVKPGEQVTLRIRRGEQTMVVPVPTYAPKGEPGRAALGVLLHTARQYTLPVPVTVAAGDIEGPSGGLMFTLQIIAQLDKGEDITHGWTVAGTGTISADGTVGEIGAIRQKVYTSEAAGAQVMFVPRANYADAAKVARHLQVVPVDRLQDALGWLHNHAAGPGAVGN